MSEAIVEAAERWQAAKDALKRAEDATVRAGRWEWTHDHCVARTAMKTACWGELRAAEKALTAAVRGDA